MQQAFDAGIKAYERRQERGGDASAFDAAIRGGLPSAADRARMLYYRGLAFRKLGKPGFAISDLTSALWLKDGLSEAERAGAIEDRALAYKEAGISNVPTVPQSTFAMRMPPSTTGWPDGHDRDPAVHPAMHRARRHPRSHPAGPAHAPGSALAATSTTHGLAPSTSSGGIGGFFSSIDSAAARRSTPNANAGSSSTSSITPPAAPAGSGSSTADDRLGRHDRR